MPFGAKRGFSDHLMGRQARELEAATRHADAIGRPLLNRIHINWGRTSAGDDPDGHLLAAFRRRITRWFRRHGEDLYLIGIRERPTHPAPKPNDHLHLHVPDHLVEAFKATVVGLLPRGVRPFDKKAVLFDGIGWTDPARQGALDYIRKGTAPKAARLLGIKPEEQGRVYGKRYVMTENLGPAARLRHAETNAPQIGKNEAA